MTGTSGKRRRGRVDAVMAVLVHLITDESWDRHRAARQLRDHVDDNRVLQQARARVGWARAERPGRFGERATATLDLALALPRQARVTDDRGGPA